MGYPQVRLRRRRRTPAMRSLTRETRLHPHDFIAPLFVVEGSKQSQPIASMPGQSRFSPDMLVAEASELLKLGVGGVLLFGVTDKKDPSGKEAFNPQGVVHQAVRLLKKELPGLLVATDACLCEYTDHGHCGVLKNGEVANDETLPLLAQMAVSHAEAGADIVAPSDMMDGRVAALRAALDQAGHTNTSIMAYSAKFASAFYGPFRDAAGSAPGSGDRCGYQMDPPNAREALREMDLDYAEGADILMVKPGLPYLDILSKARARFDCPLAVYQVSGEYAMLLAAGEKGLLDLGRARDESLLALKRAGADILISYFAKEFARDFKKRGGLEHT